MVARDRRRADIEKFLEAYRSLAVPDGNAAERAIWVILQRHGTKEGATRALAALWRRYTDVNEFRVAKVTEIADVIEKHVKNDAFRVAAHARGFLRTFFVEFQGVDFGTADERTADQLKKYLTALTENAQDDALALALHACAAEQRLEDEPEDPDGKPKKRPEKELTAAANRLRLLFTYSAHGAPTYKGKVVSSGRSFVKMWSYSTLPPLPPPPPPPKRVPIVIPRPEIPKKKMRKKVALKSRAPVPAKPVAKKPVAKKPVAKKKAAPKKAVAKKKATPKAAPKKKAASKKTAPKKAVAKRKTAKKAAGKARPKTSRATHGRAAKKKSSRR